EQRLNEQRDARREQQQTRESARRQARLSERERQRLISLQQQRAAEYRRYLVARQDAERQRILTLQQQRRMQQYRYQQWYWQRQHDMRANWAAQRYSYDNDPYYYTPASYRYYRTGRYYEVNRYAANLLQQAVRYGYQEGVRAGRADRYDGWRNDYRHNYAYNDANYGYYGYYVDQSEYNHYFREGFRRGYEDAYGRDYRYGNYDDGSYSILATVLQAILNLQPFG
ncbi:MAG TPA: hypothetical protein VJ484_11230, partial [Lysobacter sp.]|nr:hypothetical protein [Lysobacter sp.]